MFVVARQCCHTPLIPALMPACSVDEFQDSQDYTEEQTNKQK